MQCSVVSSAGAPDSAAAVGGSTVEDVAVRGKHGMNGLGSSALIHFMSVSVDFAPVPCFAIAIALKFPSEDGDDLTSHILWI